jgi:WD40 repeat protein
MAAYRRIDETGEVQNGRSEGNQWGAIAEGPRVALFSEYNDGDHQIFVWKFDGRRAPQILTNTEGGKTAVVVTPDARTAISGHVDHVCRVWDLARGRLRSTLAGHSQIVTEVAISRDGRRALSGSDDESVRLWDLADASCLCVFNGHSRAITAVELNPDSTVAASGSEDGNIYLWDTETGKVTGELDSPTKQSVHGLRFNADGSRLATVHWESIRLWDAATGQALAQFQHEGHYPTQVAFLEDEGVLISLSRSVIRRWRLPG